MASHRTLFSSDVVSLGEERCAIEDPAFVVPARVSGFRVVFPRHGVWITTSRARRYRSDATVVEFHNDGDHFSRAPLDPRGDRTDWFAVSEPVLRDLVKRHDPQALDGRYLLRLPSAATDTRAYADQRALFRYIRQGMPGDIAVEEAALTIIDRILARAYGTARPAATCITRHEREVADRTRLVLDRIGGQRTSLVRISREVGVSVFHLCRIFHKVTGQTLARHHLQLRLLASLEDLGESDDPVSDIAMEYGFRSRAHYGQAFRRVFGTSPAAWRHSHGGSPAGTRL